ncbi:division/cell wall cluster transcriptional repressor MraZ [Aureispira anguillae]|uniref:Transcriptional regulator MraZ n=1 Tax=Aureispira anguillae TaxID=2864201 RepID=A0A915YGQ6_9BACT|nr:division/cell wall cluster transcriptional repressor MraZ [Aureispira anguillae]BDS12860.1 division/cell wall cluster transcriptional repressor MraZ [Aureispira anguillae]
MIQFLGEYNCKIDAKGRLRLPAPLLKQLGDLAQDGFVLNRGFEKCLVLYPRQAWDTISKDIQKLNQYVKKNRDFVRYFFRGATELELDSNSRLLFPRTLLDYGQVNKELVLFAYFDKIEVWSKENYEALLNDEPMDFDVLAEEVMGNLNGGSQDGEIELS